MDAFVTLFIALMPLFAVAPLAIGAVAAVALLVSPRLRETVAEWARQRLRPDAAAPDALRARELEALRTEVRRLAERVDFVERIVTLPQGPVTAAVLPGSRPQAGRSPATPTPA